MASDPEQRTPDASGLVIAGGLLLVAIIIAIDTLNLRVTSTYGLGPEAMPIVVAGGLTLLAIGNAIAAWQGRLPAREPFDLRAILLVLGGLAALIAIIGLGGGFIIAIAILFTATSAAFGRRATGKDAAIGLALGVVIYLAFDRLLTLSLPAGPLERLL